MKLDFFLVISKLQHKLRWDHIGHICMPWSQVVFFFYQETKHNSPNPKLLHLVQRSGLGLSLFLLKELFVIFFWCHPCCTAFQTTHIKGKTESRHIFIFLLTIHIRAELLYRTKTDLRGMFWSQPRRSVCVCYSHCTSPTKKPGNFFILWAESGFSRAPALCCICIHRRTIRGRAFSSGARKQPPEITLRTSNKRRGGVAEGVKGRDVSGLAENEAEKVKGETQLFPKQKNQVK